MSGNGTKDRFQGYCEADLLERAKRVAFWTPGLTLSGLVEEAIRREVERREADRGEPFPDRTGDLPKGRPLGGA